MLNLTIQEFNNYTHEFNDQGYVIIDGLLDMQLLKKWSEELEKIPDKYWTQIIKNKELEKDFNIIYEQKDILLNHDKALIDYNEGQFCFSFKRINESRGIEVVDNIISYFSSNELKAILSEIGQRKIDKIGVFYINRFDKGDFLTTHSDSGNSMAIVINLTKVWNPNFGGITFLLDQDNNEINNVVSPKLGRVLVFDSMKKRIPHCVSMVTSKSLFKRLAVVVRYD